MSASACDSYIWWYGTAWNLWDVIVYDRTTGTTKNITYDANADSGDPVISGNGRYVAFDSYASNLTAGEPADRHSRCLRLRQDSEHLQPGQPQQRECPGQQRQLLALHQFRWSLCSL